jgi:hypothetical protein
VYHLRVNSAKDLHSTVILRRPFGVPPQGKLREGSAPHCHPERSEGSAVKVCSTNCHPEEPTANSHPEEALWCTTSG